MDTLGGVVESVKSKLWLGSAVNATGAECETDKTSLPTAFTLNANACESTLLTAIVKDVSTSDGTMLEGLTTQLAGAPVPQVSATALLYPFTDVSVPLNVAARLTCDVSDGFAIARM